MVATNNFAEARKAYTEYMEEEVVTETHPTVVTIQDTLAERGARYGDFSDHARICQELKYTMVTQKSWLKLDDVKKQALEVIMDKVARILSGDPEYMDNWHDIQGYAKLVEDRLFKEEPRNA